jgi:hypothetical protein
VQHDEGGLPGDDLHTHGEAVGGPVDEFAGCSPGSGRNLQDHLLFGVGYQSLVDLPVPALLAEAGAFLHTRPASPGASPDLQFFVGPI